MVHNRSVHHLYRPTRSLAARGLRRKGVPTVSQRTRENRGQKPGAAANNKPPRFDRQVEHRRVRHAANIQLATMAEPEDLALPRPVHTSMKTDPQERPQIAVRKRRFKVWKTKAWKRRSQVRAERAAAYRPQDDG